MARINNTQPSLQNSKTFQEVARYAALTLGAILDQVNGKLDFGDNVRTSGPTSVAFIAANAPVKIAHTLGRIPMGYFVTSQDAAGNVLVPVGNGVTWNATNIFLSASAIMNADVLIF